MQDRSKAETAFLTNILAESASKVLNSEQTAAVERIDNWLDFGEDREFILSGYAGTGKTFCLRHLVAMRTDLRVVYTAPTNKAARVLRETLGRRALTIYSLLGLKLSPTGELKEIVGSEPPDLTQTDLIVVDEGSMVNTLLREHINEAIKRHSKLRVLFLGDPAQLPPVGEINSPIWSIPRQATLEKVMRHDSSILSVCTYLRGKVNSPFGTVAIPRFADIPTLSRPDFTRALVDNAESFSKPGQARTIAWRNVRVDHFNGVIRGALFPGVNQEWVVGDRLALLEPAIGEDGEQLAITDDEGVVTKVSSTTVEKLPCWSLSVTLDTNERVQLWTLKRSAKEEYDERMEKLRSAAKLNGRKWRDFWEFYEKFHRVRYAYAITAHKSQGSTYDTVFVDVADILQNRNRREAFQCLYVACSRAASRLVLCQSL